MAEGAAAFALIYLTFFLDNMLLTVLVPIIPDWVRGESLALWAERADAPLAGLLNHTVRRLAQREGAGAGEAAGEWRGVGAPQLVAGLVLGAKAAAQLGAAPLAGAMVARRGAAPVLRAATAALALAALGLALCSGLGGARAAWCAGCARAAHGAGAALSGVAGLALAARALAPAERHRGLGLLLGAVALGVLVGYPFGGASSALLSRAAPFLVIAAALLADLALQYMFLDKEEYNQGLGASGGTSGAGMAAEARRGAVGACAGCVLLTTSALAVLEPCLPAWAERRWRPSRWQLGLVFVPDSLGYLLATSAGGGLARRFGAERQAIAGQVLVGLAALAVPGARSLGALAAPHVALGLGLGAADAALVPALLARGGRGRGAAARAALLQAAGAAAYAAGPALGGALAAAAGFEATMRTAAALNLLYAAYLYTRLRRYPLSEQWGASADDAMDSDDDTSEDAQAEATPLEPGRYAPLE